MARYATFDTVSLLHRSGPTSVWSARSMVDGGGPADHCLKAVRGTADDATAAEQLLAGAGLQQAMAFQCPGWAPVRALGADGHGAFCVTDRYPRSAQTIIDGPARVSSADLRTLVVAILDALIELQVAYNRPHGNLKPSNVLIGRRVRSGQVCLTDPAADPTARPSLTRAPDPKALGRLVYALVTHRPHNTAGWPMRFDDHWHRLGASGRAWFDLCQSLMHPLGDASPDLDELMTRVVALRPDRRRRAARGVRHALVAVPLSVAALAAAYVERVPLAAGTSAAGRQVLALVQSRPAAKPHRPNPLVPSAAAHPKPWFPPPIAGRRVPPNPPALASQRDVPAKPAPPG